MNAIIEMLGLPETITISSDVLAPAIIAAAFILFQFMWRDYDRRHAITMRKLQNVPTKEWTHLIFAHRGHLALSKAYASQKQLYRFAGRMPEKWHRLFLECLELGKGWTRRDGQPVLPRSVVKAKQELILNTLKGWKTTIQVRYDALPGESPLLTCQQGGKFLFDVFGTEQCPPDDVYEAMSGFVVG